MARKKVSIYSILIQFSKKKNILNLYLAESTEARPKDTEGSVYVEQVLYKDNNFTREL